MAGFGPDNPNALIVEFDQEQFNYLLYLKSDLIDSVAVGYYATIEKCCFLDSTYWIENIKYSELETYFPDNDIGSEYLVVD